MVTRNTGRNRARFLVDEYMAAHHGLEPQGRRQWTFFELKDDGTVGVKFTTAIKPYQAAQAELAHWYGRRVWVVKP